MWLTGTKTLWCIVFESVLCFLNLQTYCVSPFELIQRMRLLFSLSSSSPTSFSSLFRNERNFMTVQSQASLSYFCRFKPTAHFRQLTHSKTIFFIVLWALFLAVSLLARFLSSLNDLDIWRNVGGCYLCTQCSVQKLRRERKGKVNSVRFLIILRRSFSRSPKRISIFIRYENKNRWRCFCFSR